MSDAKPPKTGLRLLARDAEDLQVLSACLQDALVTVRDIVFLRDQRQLAMVVNRFRWERKDEGESEGERVLAALAIGEACSVQVRGIDAKDRERILELLTIGVRPAPQGTGATVELDFAGGAAMRVAVDRLVCRLEDLSEPWPTVFRPRHPTGEGAA